MPVASWRTHRVVVLLLGTAAGVGAQTGDLSRGGTYHSMEGTAHSFTAVTHTFYGAQATTSWFANNQPSSNWTRTLPLFPATQYFFPFLEGGWNPAHCDAASFVPPSFPSSLLPQYALLLAEEYIWYDCNLDSIEALGFGAVIFVTPSDPVLGAAGVQEIGRANMLSMPVFVMPYQPYLEWIVPDMLAARAAANGSWPQFQPVTLSAAYGNPLGVCLGDLGVRIFQMVLAVVFLGCMGVAWYLLFTDRVFGWPHFIYVGQGLMVSGKYFSGCVLNPGWSYPVAWKLFIPYRFSTEPIEFSTNLANAWMYMMVAVNFTRRQKKIGHVVVACTIVTYYCIVYPFFADLVAVMVTVPLQSSEYIKGKINRMLNAFYYSNVACTLIYILTLVFCIMKLTRVASTVGSAGKHVVIRSQLKIIIIFNSFQIVGSLILMCNHFGWEATSYRQDFNTAGRPEHHAFNCFNLYALYAGSAISSAAQLGFFYYNRVFRRSQSSIAGGISGNERATSASVSDSANTPPGRVSGGSGRFSFRISRSRNTSRDVDLSARRGPASGVPADDSLSNRRSASSDTSCAAADGRRVVRSPVAPADITVSAC